MKYIGLFDEKEDIVTKEKLEAVEAAIPTKVSELINDANYITAAQAPVQSVNGKTGVVTVREVPAVTTADNGKFLRVVNGAWAAVEIANANGGSF